MDLAPHGPEAARGPHPGRLDGKPLCERSSLLASLVARRSSSRRLTTGAARRRRRSAGRRTEPGFDERLARSSERRAALAQELARLRGQEKSLLGEVERLELEVRLRSEELEAARIELQRTQAEMDAAPSRESGELERSVAVMRPVLAAHARGLYKLGDLSYLRLLLSVERPSDFFRGYGLVTSLARRDSARMSAFRSDLAGLSAADARRSSGAPGRRSRCARSSSGRGRTLDRDRRRKTELLTSLVERKEMHAAFVAELEQRRGAPSRPALGPRAPRTRASPWPPSGGALPWPVEGPGRARLRPQEAPELRHLHAAERHRDRGPARARAVRAVHEGQVVFADRFKGYGLMVAVDHGGKHHTVYAHLAEIAVAGGREA